MADLQHDLDVDKAAAFSIMMAHGKGISSKSPDYMMEKWRGIQQCRDQMEVVSFLDIFGQHIFFKWRDAWFKESHADSWPYDAVPSPVTIPSEGSCSSTTNEGEKQEVFLRYISCGDHPPFAFCYLQDDGTTHVQKNVCVCGTYPSEDCPIDLHRRQAVGTFAGQSGLFA